MATVEDLAKLSYAVYAEGGYDQSHPLPSSSTSWVVINEANPTERQSGFYAAAYRNVVTKEIIIAVRGTGILDWLDWKDNALAFLNKQLAQFDTAKEFVNRVIQEAANSQISTANVAFTGHSLGGALAGMLGVAFNKFSTGFNSVGAKGALAELGYDVTKNYNASIVNIRGISGSESIFSQPTQRQHWLLARIALTAPGPSAHHRSSHHLPSSAGPEPRVPDAVPGPLRSLS